jgi:hypothetical protein
VKSLFLTITDPTRVPKQCHFGILYSNFFLKQHHLLLKIDTHTHTITINLTLDQSLPFAHASRPSIALAQTPTIHAQPSNCLSFSLSFTSITVICGVSTSRLSPSCSTELPFPLLFFSFYFIVVDEIIF